MHMHMHSHVIQPESSEAVISAVLRFQQSCSLGMEAGATFGYRHNFALDSTLQNKYHYSGNNITWILQIGREVTTL